MSRKPKLSESAQKHERELHEAQLEILAVRAKHALRRIKEAIALDWDFLSPYRNFDGTPINSEGQWIPVNNQSAHRAGSNFPFYQTEQQLGFIREMSRIVVGTSNHAKGILRGLCSYTIGTGMKFKVTPKKGIDQEVAKGADARVTEWLDEWAREVRWNERQQECYRRVQRDGDAILVMQPVGGKLALRFRWPELLVQPPGGDFEEWSFGIRTDPNDVETRLEYHFLNPTTPTQPGEFLSASEVIHFVDRETDSGVKRGLPLFSFDCKDSLDTASRLIRNLGEGSAVREAIAFLREHATASEEEVQEFLTATSDYKEKKPIRNSYTNVSKLDPGTVMDAPEGLKFAPPPANTGTAAHSGVVDILVRSACSRVNAPEWLGSSNAENMGAYTSSLVAESPFVKGVVADQEYYKSRFMVIVDRALKLAVASGLLSPADLALVDVDLVPPSPETRNKLEESQRAAIEIPLGVDSRQNYCSAQGRDFDTIKADNKAWEDEHSGPGEPLELPPGMGPGPRGSWPGTDAGAA